MRHPLIKIFQLSNWLQMPDDHRMVYIQFFTNFSCNCKRIEFSGCSQLVVIKFRPRAWGWGCHDHPVLFLLGSPGSFQDWMIPTNTVARMGGLEVNYPPPATTTKRPPWRLAPRCESLWDAGSHGYFRGWARVLLADRTWWALGVRGLYRWVGQNWA